MKGNTIVFNTTSLYNASKQSLVATVIAWIIAITVIAASSGLAQANEAIAANSPKAGSEPTTQSTVTNKTPSEFVINMRDADLRAFIQWIADRTNKNMIVHRSVNGTATVISNRPVTPDEAYELFLTVLSFNGFTAIEEGNTVKIIPDAEAKSSVTANEKSVEWEGEVVTTIIDIKHAGASEIANAIKPLVPASSHFAAYLPTNSLIVADSARGIEKIRELIAVLDKQEGEIDLEIIPIIHASAEDIVKVLESVVSALSGASGAADKAGEGEIQFAVDKRSNSILMTGNKRKRKQIKQLITKLDTPLDGNGSAQVVYLNYATAEDLAPILKNIGESALKEAKAEDTKSFSIEASKETNALIISAPPSLMATLKSIIEKLDIQRAQVLVEAVVVQVSGNAGDDFGVIWGASDLYNENDKNGVVGAVNTESANAPVSDIVASTFNSSTSSSLTNRERLAAGLLSSSGLNFGYLEDGNLIAALRTITTKNKSNIMSTPTIVALDNEEASLLVGQNVPFVTGSSTSAGADITNPFQTIQRQDIGITLKITPRINQGDSISLEIEQTTENVSPNTVSGAADLVTEKTEIKTRALIKDGQVLVIGGLIREDESKTHTQVPILGSIPVIGRLFRSHSVSKTKNNLMVFIRPVILKDQLQITGLTAQRYAFMREKQLQRALSTFIRYSDSPLLDEFETFAPQSPKLASERESVTIETSGVDEANTNANQ